MDEGAEPIEDAAQTEAPKSQVVREEPTLDPARANAVSEWKKTILADKEHWRAEFKRMRTDMEFAKLGSDGTWKAGGNYTANIIQRHINTRVSDLYAKNPRVVAKVRDRMEFVHWDGSMETLAVAQVAIAANPNDIAARTLIEDATQGVQRKTMLQNIARTMQITHQYFQDEQEPSFKRSIKRGVRRSLVTGVAYCELGFQRILEKQPEITQQLQDAAQRLARIESLAADVSDGETREDSPDRESLRVMIEGLQAQEEITVREGPTYDWAIGSTEIIVDQNCRQLNGFIGAGHVAREMPLTAKQIQETYGVDIRNGSTAANTSVDGTPATVTTGGDSQNSSRASDKTKRSVWKVWDKRDGTEFVICDSWPDYLVAPKTPDVQIERFWPIFVLEFNPIEETDTPESETDSKARRRIHGLSDVELIRDMQEEYNRDRQGLREHRIANRPATVTPRGAFEDDDLAQLGSHAANDVILMNALAPGQKIADLLMAKPTVPIDPNLYDVSPYFDDIQRTSGTQEANLGGLTGATATEASIAEGGRAGSTQSNIDDLDELLTELARATGQLLLHSMSAEHIKRIAGPGAVWPELSAQEISEEVFLTVKAGSSGRPNRELEIANMERMAPFLLQVPGISARWLAEKMIERVDEDYQIEDAFIDGLPSVMAQNALGGGSAGAVPADAGKGPASDPGAQGAQGAQNDPQPQGAAPPGSSGQSAQPAFPAPSIVQ